MASRTMAAAMLPLQMKSRRKRFTFFGTRFLPIMRALLLRLAITEADYAIGYAVIQANLPVCEYSGAYLCLLKSQNETIYLICKIKC